MVPSGKHSPFANWKITMLLMGNFDLAIFNSKLLVYQRVILSGQTHG